MRQSASEALRVVGVAGLFALGLLFSGGSARASMIGHAELKLDFGKPDEVATKARWARSDLVRPLEGGLGWEGDASSYHDVWIETSEPFAVGFSWRPVSSVSVRATATWRGPAADGIRGRLFARHSPDGVHWSTWQELEGAEDNASSGRKSFRGTLSVPRREREAYDERRQAYAKLDVPWASDEEAAVRWMVARDPELFAREKPFVG